MAIRTGPGAVIAAAAITPVGQYTDRTSVDLAEAALDAALRDADLRRADVDGIVWNLGTSIGANYDLLCDRLGLRTRYVVQTWTHGRFTATCVALAAMAVAAGGATVVACVGGIKNFGSRASVARRDGSGREAFLRPAADALQRYVDRYGVNRNDLADIALSARRYADLNPTAFLRELLTADDYAASPTAFGSLKEADCFPSDESFGPVHDVGVCVLVTTPVRAAILPPVYLVAGQGVQGGPEEVYLARPGLGDPPADFAPSAFDLSAFTDSGLSVGDMDAFYTYEPYAPMVWYSLERFGYCPPGLAPSMTTIERMWLDGALPINTNGGMLAAGHTCGWGQIVEMVHQLQGVAGRRQLDEPELLHWGSVFGDSLILTNNVDRAVSRPNRS